MELEDDDDGARIHHVSCNAGHIIQGGLLGAFCKQGVDCAVDGFADRAAVQDPRGIDSDCGNGVKRLSERNLW